VILKMSPKRASVNTPPGPVLEALVQLKGWLAQQRGHEKLQRERQRRGLAEAYAIMARALARARL